MNDLMLPARRRRAAAVSGGRPPVRTLLLHGMGGGVGIWDSLVEAVDGRFELWDVELPWSLGHDVQWAQNSDTARWIDAAVRGLRAGCGSAPDLVVAHSFAANAAMEAAGFSGGPGAVPTVLLNPFFRADPSDFEWGSIAYYTEGFHQMLEDGLRLRAGGRITDSERSALALRLCEFMGPYPWLRFFDTFLRTPLCDPDLFRAAVLLVAGDRDQGAKPDGVRALGKRLPTARLEVLQDCGHFPMIEQPERLAALIADFADQAFADLSPRTTPRSPDR